VSKKRKQAVKLSRMNWDSEYFYDIIYGNGFTITEPAEVAIDETKEKALYGAQSPLYGTSYSDEHAFIERYRCKCGEFQGRQFDGEECPICHTKVEFKDSDINVTGWIDLAPNRIINPYYFNLLSQTLGKNVFPDIVSAKYRITKDGKREKPNNNDAESPASSPYAGIGVDEFFKNYENILIYFKSKKKNKISTIDRLIDEKAKVFTSHIPVYSTFLRPQSVTSDTFYYGTIDKIINTLFTLSESLKECIDVERDFILQRMQNKVNAMWDITFNQLNGKEGFIRGQLLGGSLNYTARNVIIPEPGLKDNMVDLSYHTALELFKSKIIYYLMKLDGISMGKAAMIWQNAFKFDEKVYDIMMFMVEHNDAQLLINRNPTLNFYSMLLMKIRKIKHDKNDYCLSVPLSIDHTGEVDIKLF